MSAPRSARDKFDDVLSWATLAFLAIGVPLWASGVIFDSAVATKLGAGALLLFFVAAPALIFEIGRSVDVSPALGAAKNPLEAVHLHGHRTPLGFVTSAGGAKRRSNTEEIAPPDAVSEGQVLGLRNGVDLESHDPGLESCEVPGQPPCCVASPQPSGQRAPLHHGHLAPLRVITNITGPGGLHHPAVVIDADGGEVARISRYGTDAHAFLFAAAPDLLDASKALLEAQTDESVSAARRAIAKAENGGRR